MYIFYKIINAIDGLLNQIPKDVATNIKRLAGFIFFILAIIVMYQGYQAGVSDSEIPGQPLVNETNDALRLKGQKKGSGMNLVESPPPILDLDNPSSKQKERLPQKSDIARPEDSDVLGEGSVRGLDPQDANSSNQVLGLDQRPISGKQSETSDRYRSMDQAEAPKPLSDRFRHFSRVGAKPKSSSGPSSANNKDNKNQSLPKTNVHTPLLPDDFSPMEEPRDASSPNTNKSKPEFNDSKSKNEFKKDTNRSESRSPQESQEKKQKPQQVQPLDPFD